MTRRLKEKDLRKIAPILRVVAHAPDEVNLIRAEQTPMLAYEDPEILEENLPKLLVIAQTAQYEDIQESFKREDGREPSKRALVNVFIEFVEPQKGLFPKDDDSGEALADLPESVQRLERSRSKSKNLITTTISLEELHDLAADDLVTAVEIGNRIVVYTPDVITAEGSSPRSWLEKIKQLQEQHKDKPVLIGIIDVQGFDFSHPDFLDENGQTRFYSIWDQGGINRDHPIGFDFGSEITKDHMNSAINASDEYKLAPYLLEPQTQMSISSHATHVTSIAAGKSGVCPHAILAGVLLELPEADKDSRKSFYDSTRIAHAVDYLFQKGKELGDIPVSINISLGTNGHAHDASSPTSRWIDFALSNPGRCVTVATGNAGQETPVSPNDIGFVMGRIHTSGRIPAAGLTTDIEWVVVGDGIGDFSENELEIWYSPQDRFAVQVKPPETDTWLPIIKPGKYLQNYDHHGTFISIYNELYAPANGLNYISIHLNPLYSNHGIVAIKPGVWTVRLHGHDIRDGSYHGWIERDDPRRLANSGFIEPWSFPSFFTAHSNVDNSSVSSLACGQRIISVANLDEREERINITSSQGPTRDGRKKPDIAAPGTGIIAANGFGSENLPWVKMSGTSMASPYVAGVIGLMLSANAMLTSAQIVGIIHRTAKPLPGADYRWQNDAGFGQIDIVACVREAKKVGKSEEIDNEDDNISIQ